MNFGQQLFGTWACISMVVVTTADIPGQSPSSPLPQEAGANSHGQTVDLRSGNNVVVGAAGEATDLHDSSAASGDAGNADRDRDSTDKFPGSPELNRLLTAIVLDNMPHQYVENKKWGHHGQRWAGFEFRRDGPRGKLETQRKFKMVNDGTWRKYSAELIDPQKSFSVKLQEISRTPEGKTVFQISFSTDLKIDARQSKWVHGVQMYSISAEGHARVNLKIGCELGIGIDFSRLPPDLVFQPTITDARIAIEQFKIDRISKAGGEVAVQLTRLARRELEEKIDRKERRLVEKLNEKIAKNQEKFRLSTAEAVRLKWYDQANAFLPENVQRVLSD